MGDTKKKKETEIEAEKETEEQTVKKTEKQKLKNILRFFAIAFAALLLILGALYLVKLLLKGEKVDYTQKQEDIYYFSADYDASPLDDEVYVAKNREVMFTDHTGRGEPLTAYAGEGKDAKALFYNYFKALVEGDADAHLALLAQNYKDSFVVPERFTPQKVYDISISFLTGVSDGGKYVEKYQVSYKIYENNGTYRADVGSNVAKIMSFDVIIENGRAMINSIAPINTK